MKVGGQKGWQDISVSCTSHGFRAGIKQRLMPAGSTGILPFWATDSGRSQFLKQLLVLIGVMDVSVSRCML